MKNLSKCLFQILQTNNFCVDEMAGRICSAGLCSRTVCQCETQDSTKTSVGTVIWRETGRLLLL